MTSPYSIGNDVVTVGGKDSSGLQSILKSTIGANYAITAGIIVVLVIIIVYLLWKSREGLATSGPTSMMRYVQQSLSGSDALAMPSPAECAAAAANPAPGGAWNWMANQAREGKAATIDPKAMAAGESGQYAASGEYYEGMASKKEANTDAALTAVMAGF